MTVETAGSAQVPQSRLRGIAKRIMMEVAIIVTSAAVLLGGWYSVQTWNMRHVVSIASTASTQAASVEISPRPVFVAGEHLEANGVSRPRGTFSMILVLSPSCHYCVHSVPFYHRVIEAARKAHFAMHVAVPTSEATARFISEAGLQELPIINWRSLNRKVLATPSILLWGPDDIVRRIWTGELDSKGEEEVFAAIRTPASVRQPLLELSSGEHVMSPEEVRTKNDAIIVSPAERASFEKEHPSGAINIPLKELLQRADYELRRDHLTVVDCSEQFELECSRALEYLRRDKFRVVAADLSSAEKTYGPNNTQAN